MPNRRLHVDHRGDDMHHKDHEIVYMLSQQTSQEGRNDKAASDQESKLRIDSRHCIEHY